MSEGAPDHGSETPLPTATRSQGGRTAPPPRSQVDGPGARDERKWVAAARGGLTLEELEEGPWEVVVALERWRPSVLSLVHALRFRLATLWGENAHDGDVEVHGIFLGGAECRGVHLRVDLPGAARKLPSLLPDLPTALYFERELSEMFGVTILASPDTRPLLLHERHTAPPMLPAGGEPTGVRAPFGFARTEGEGVYEIPVGPVHAGVIEPGHFRFQVRGEEILNLEVRLGYTHKGTERLFEGLEPSQATILAESISGDMSVAGATAYALAVEDALRVPVPPAAQSTRGLLLELERAAFLMGDVAGIILDVGYAAGAAEANVLREQAYGALELLTGSRLGRGTVVPGGLARPVPTEARAEVERSLEGVRRGLAGLIDHVHDQPSIMDRLRGTGVIPLEVAEALGLVGPAARASGLDRDVRRDRPYGPYAHERVRVRVASRSEGDVEGRFEVKVAEVLEACRLARHFLGEGGSTSGSPIPSRSAQTRHGLGIVESPRGEFLVALRASEQGKRVLTRVHVRDPSFLNWPAIEYAVRGNIVPDFPLCNKSLNLSYSGFDR